MTAETASAMKSPVDKRRRFTADQPVSSPQFHRDKKQICCCRGAASATLTFRPPWDMTTSDERRGGQALVSAPTANPCTRRMRPPNRTRRERAQQRKAAHVDDHREPPRRIDEPVSHGKPADAAQTRTPIVRLRPRRLVATINRTRQRTTRPTDSTLATSRLDRQRALPRKRLVPSTPGHQTPRPSSNHQCPPRIAQRNLAVRPPIRKARPTGRTSLHRVHPRVRRDDKSGQCRRRVQTRPTTRNHAPQR